MRRRSRRSVRNEDQLIQSLQRCTSRLQVVESMGQLNVRQQAMLVCSNDLLIGPHGAGFTHLIYRVQGPGRAVEIMAEGNGSLAFALISQRLGIDHAIYVGDSVATDKGSNYPDIEVSIDELLNLAGW